MISGRFNHSSHSAHGSTMPSFSDRSNASDDENSPSATPNPAPLQVKKPRPNPRRMQIVPATSAFELPEGWVVEKRARGPNAAVHAGDKYYYEPKTGQKFRSLISVKRYLTGEELVPRPMVSEQRNRCGIWTADELESVHQKKHKHVIRSTRQHRSSSIVPEGWIVESVPRRSSCRSDRYFIEPETGMRFRSAPEVHRYLAGEGYRGRCKALTSISHSSNEQSSRPCTRSALLKMIMAKGFDILDPPERINWVYSGDGKDTWRPLIEGSVIPDYIKEQWHETFLLGMNGWKHQVPLLTMSEGNGTEAPCA